MQLEKLSSLRTVQVLSRAVSSFLAEELLPHFHWQTANELILQRVLLTSKRTKVAAFSEVLPILTCVVVGGEVSTAIPLAANWWLLLFAAQLLDDVQDQDADWSEVSELSSAQLLSAAVYALGIAQTSLAKIPVDCTVLSSVLSLVGEMQAHAAHAQGMELTQTSKQRSLEMYYRLSVQKSANLFASICDAGARLGCRDPKQWESCNQFGMSIGLMKQIQDDVADLHDPLGKSDLMARHDTMPLLKGLGMRDQAQHAELCALVQSAERTTDIAQQIKEILTEIGAIQFCLQVAEGHRAQAIAALQTFPTHLTTVLRDYAAC